MQHRNTIHQEGFTLIELMVSIVLMAVIGTTFLVFFKSTIFDYINLQGDASTMTQINTQESRIAEVLRGVSNITSASDNDFQGYSYFYPQNEYVSIVHYYVASSGGIKQVKADVTPMTSNPPVGTPITSGLKTYTIIDNYYQLPGTALFTYLNSSGNPISTPVADLQSIKSIQTNLAVPLSNGGNQVLNVQVNLRSRKTNL